MFTTCMRENIIPLSDYVRSDPPWEPAGTHIKFTSEYWIIDYTNGRLISFSLAFKNVNIVYFHRSLNTVRSYIALFVL